MKRCERKAKKRCEVKTMKRCERKTEKGCEDKQMKIRVCKGKTKKKGKEET